MRKSGYGLCYDLVYAIVFGIGVAIGRMIFRAAQAGWRQPAIRILMGAAVVALIAPTAWAAALGPATAASWATVWAVVASGGWHGLHGGLGAVASPAVTGARWYAAVRAGGYALLASPAVVAAPGFWGGPPVLGWAAAVVALAATQAVVWRPRGRRTGGQHGPGLRGQRRLQ